MPTDIDSRLADRRRDPGPPQGLAHVDGRRAAGARGVVVAAEQEQQRVAAELQQLAAADRGLAEHRAEDAVEGPMSSSAPMRPRVASRSVRAVKPEMSANTIEASSTCHCWPGGTVSSQSSATRGTCRRRSTATETRGRIVDDHDLRTGQLEGHGNGRRLPASERGSSSARRRAARTRSIGTAISGCFEQVLEGPLREREGLEALVAGDHVGGAGGRR